MDSRVVDLRKNKRTKSFIVVYCTKKRFYEISDILTKQDYKISINSIFLKNKNNSGEAQTEVTFNVKLKRKSIESLINILLEDEKCLNIYIVNEDEQEELN